MNNFIQLWAFLALISFSFQNVSAQCGVAIQQNGSACVAVGPYNNTNSYTSWLTNAPQYTYNWTVPGNAQIVNGQGTPDIEVKWLAPGQGSISLSIMDPIGGCMDFNSISAGASGANVASPVQGPDTVCAGDTIQFINSWYYGPGFGITYYGYYSHNANQISYIQNQVPSANFTSYDTLEYSWEAGQDSAFIVFEHFRVSTGCVDYSKKDIILLGGISGPEEVCAGDTVQYTLLHGLSSNTWAATGGTIVSGQGTSTVEVVWLVTGSQSLSCNWTHPIYGTKNSSRPINIVTLTPPLISGQDTLCNSLNGMFNYSILPQPGHSYSWAVSNATFSSGLNTGPFIQIIPDTLSPITLTLYDQLGSCLDSSQLVIIYEYPGSIIIAPDNVCDSTIAEVKLERNLPGATFNWTVNGATITAGQGTDSINAVMTPSGYSTFQVNVSWNGCNSYLKDTIAVYANPDVYLGPDLTICPGWSTLLQDFMTNWNAIYLNSNGQASPSVLATTPGDYWVEKTYNYGVLSCSDRDTVSVSYYPMPTLNLGPDTVICTNPPFLLDAGSGFSSYAWSTGGNSATIPVSVSGTYSVTATANGCSLSDTVVVTFSPAASFNLGPDLDICPDTSTIIDAGTGFTTYLWSNNSSAQTLTASTAGLYWVEVTTSSCTARDSILIGILPDCVFPGDANHDGIADNTDLLNIGVAFGSAGGIRPLATQGWYGQTAPNWSFSFPSTVNYKHADSDGSGIVNDDDTLAVTNNYLLTHNKTSGVNGGGVPLKLIPQQPSYYWGDTLAVDLVLGEAIDPLVDGYGLTFSTQVQPNSAVPGAFDVRFPASFMGTKGVDLLTLWKADVQPGQHDFAVVRNNQLNVNGYGTIATLYILPDSNLFAGQDSGFFEIDLLNPYLVDNNLQSLNISSSATTITVLNPTLAGAQPFQLSLQVAPNPADRNSKISYSASIGQTVLLQVLDLRGKVLIESEVMGTGQRQIWSVVTSGLSEGMYLVRIGQNGFYSGEKLLIQR